MFGKRFSKKISALTFKIPYRFGPLGKKPYPRPHTAANRLGVLGSKQTKKRRNWSQNSANVMNWLDPSIHARCLQFFSRILDQVLYFFQFFFQADFLSIWRIWSRWRSLAWTIRVSRMKKRLGTQDRVIFQFLNFIQTNLLSVMMKTTEQQKKMTTVRQTAISKW